MSGSRGSSDSGFEVHEVIFAESLGISLQEEYALELLELATKALYILPDDWEVDFAETELGTIPFFVNTATDESHWVHPYAEDLKLVVIEKRQELMRGDEYFDEGEETDGEYFEDLADENTNRVDESAEIVALPLPGFRVEEESHAQETETLTNVEKEDLVDAHEAEIAPSGATQESKSPLPAEIPVDFQNGEISATSNKENTEEALESALASLDLQIVTEKVLGDEVSEEKDHSVPAGVEPLPSNEDKPVSSEEIDQIVESVTAESAELPSVPEPEPEPEPVVESISEPAEKAPCDEVPVSTNDESELPTKEARTAVTIAATVDNPVVEKVGAEGTATGEVELVTQETERQCEETVVAVTEIPSDPLTSNEDVVAENIAEVEATAKEATLSPESDVLVESAPIVETSLAEETNGMIIDLQATELSPVVTITTSDTISEVVGQPQITTPSRQAWSEKAAAESVEEIAELQKHEDPAAVAAAETVPAIEETLVFPMPEESLQTSSEHDAFADFFAIDDSFHRFIDEAERKEQRQHVQHKTKQQSKQAVDKPLHNKRKNAVGSKSNSKQKSAEKTISEEIQRTVDDEKEWEDVDEESVDLDQLLRQQRRQEALREQQAEQARREQLLQQQREQKEKEEKEQAEREANAAQAIAAQALLSLQPLPPPSAESTVRFDILDDIAGAEAVPEDDSKPSTAATATSAEANLSASFRLLLQTGPVTPLDKTVDITEHFRMLYGSPITSAAAADQLVAQESQHQQQTRYRGRQSTLRRQPSTNHHFSGGNLHQQAEEEEEFPEAGDANANHRRLDGSSSSGLHTLRLVDRKPRKSPQKLSKLSKDANATTVTNNNTATRAVGGTVDANGEVWIVLGAYSNYREAQRAVALFEALAPTKSIANTVFPSHSKHLPPPSAHPATMISSPSSSSLTGGPSGSDDPAQQTTPTKKRNLLLSSTAPLTKESILLSTQQELPKVRIARDLGRMQWLVECNDAKMKKVFQRRVVRRLQRGQGEALLPSLHTTSSTSASSQDNNATSMSSPSSSTSPLKATNVFTANFVPQSLISNVNTKHVAGRLAVHYPLPRLSYEAKTSLSMSRTNPIRDLDNTSSTTISNKHKTRRQLREEEEERAQRRGPLTFRAVLAQQRVQRHQQELQQQQQQQQQHPDEEHDYNSPLHHSPVQLHASRQHPHQLQPHLRQSSATAALQSVSHSSSDAHHQHSRALRPVSSAT